MASVRPQSTPKATQTARGNLASPFLTPSVAPPLAPLEPVDLHGARIRATLNHVKNEIAAMRVDLEGVMQVRDELESMRRELDLVKQLFDAQGTLLEKRILEAVSSLFDSRLAPLFDSVLKASNSLSATFATYESSSVARARGQNGRIEEVEASNRRRLEEIERQLKLEVAGIKRDDAAIIELVEERVKALLDVESTRISKEVTSRISEEVAKRFRQLGTCEAGVAAQDARSSSYDKLTRTMPDTTRAQISPSERASAIDLGLPTRGGVPVNSGPSSTLPAQAVIPCTTPSASSKLGSKSTPTKLMASTHLDPSPPSPPRRRGRTSSKLRSSEESGRIVASATPSIVAQRQVTSKSRVTPQHEQEEGQQLIEDGSLGHSPSCRPRSTLSVAKGRGELEERDKTTRELKARQAQRAARLTKGDGSTTNTPGSVERAKQGASNRSAGRRFIEQDLSQSQERAGVRKNIVQREQAVVTSADDDEEEPDTIE